MSHRKDLNNDLSAADRTALVNLMLQYITDAIVGVHPTINHNDVHIFTGHRAYIEEMERFLTLSGASQFVPLPKWNPANEVPVEFRVMKSKQDGTPWLLENPNMPAIQNPNADPGRAMPPEFAYPAVCSVPDGNTLGTTVQPWHDSVHNRVGGIFGQFRVTSAVPLFWCWHAFVDEIFYDWQQCQPDTSHIYRMMAVNSGLVADIKGGSLSPGAPLIQWDWHGDTNQQWELIPLTDVNTGYYQIRSVHSGLVLDVEGGSVEQGAPIIQWHPHGEDNQKWRFSRINETSFHIQSKLSNMAMDVFGGFLDPGEKVIQWPLHGGPNQTWILTPVNHP